VHGLVGVGEEREREVLVFLEGGEFRGLVARHTEHLVAGRLERVEVVAEVARLGGAAGGVGLGVEVDDRLLPTEVAERHLHAVLVEERELRCGCSRGQSRNGVGHGSPLVERASHDALISW